MTTGFRKFCFCAIGSALLLHMASAAHAALLVYEPFDYQAGSELYDQGTLTGLNGGGGWAGAWTGRNGNTAAVPAGTTSIIAGSLAHPTQPGDLPTSGGHVRINGITTGSTSTEPTRQFSATATATVAASSTLWYSFLAQRVGDPSDPIVVGTNPYPRGVNVSMFHGNATTTPNATEALGIGNSSNHINNTWSIVPNGAGGNTEGAYSPPGSTAGLTGGPENMGATPFPFEVLQWVVVRLDLDGTSGADSAYMWLSPDPLVEPNIANAQAAILNTDTNSFNYDGIGSFRPFVGSQQGTAGNTNFRPAGGLLLDEVRIGTTYAAMTSTVVVPEPASLVMLVLGGLALALRIRR